MFSPPGLRVEILHPIDGGLGQHPDRDEPDRSESFFDAG
jgi:hypothetical protein